MPGMSTNLDTALSNNHDAQADVAACVTAARAALAAGSTESAPVTLKHTEQWYVSLVNYGLSATQMSLYGTGKGTFLVICV
jgi:hypothetical protein